MIKVYIITRSKCFNPSSSSVSCDTVLGLPKGAIIFEGKGKGLFIGTETSMGFCCCIWRVGDGAETSVWKKKQNKKQMFVFLAHAEKISNIYSETA